MDEEAVLVDQARVEQRLDERAAALDEDAAPELMFQGGDSFDDIALEHARIAPWLLQRRRGDDVFRSAVEPVRHPHLVVPKGGPVRREHVVGRAAEEERIRVANALLDRRRPRVTVIRIEPLIHVVGVEDAIQRHPLEHYQRSLIVQGHV